MSEDAYDGTEVLAGPLSEGFRWAVTACAYFNDYRAREELHTTLRIYNGHRLVHGSGFAGPPLYSGQLFSEYRGHYEGFPFFVMARTVPEVDRVVATTAGGREVVLLLSESFDEFDGLRFAATPLPNGEIPGNIRIERRGTVLQTRRQWLPPRPGP